MRTKGPWWSYLSILRANREYFDMCNILCPWIRVLSSLLHLIAVVHIDFCAISDQNCDFCEWVVNQVCEVSSICQIDRNIWVKSEWNYQDIKKWPHHLLKAIEMLGYDLASSSGCSSDRLSLYHLQVSLFSFWTTSQLLSVKKICGYFIEAHSNSSHFKKLQNTPWGTEQRLNFPLDYDLNSWQISGETWEKTSTGHPTI